MPYFFRPIMKPINFELDRIRIYIFISILYPKKKPKSQNMDIFTSLKNHSEKSTYPGDILTITFESLFNYLHFETLGTRFHTFLTICDSF